MHIKARFYCEHVMHAGIPSADAKGAINGQKASEVVSMRPIWGGNNPDDPNKTFANATPSGHLQLTIENEAAWGAFQPGHIYDIDIKPAVLRPTAD